LNSALIRFQRFETRLARWVRLPFGLSVIAVLQKPRATAALTAMTSRVLAA
jgi:hypothetical protein